MAEPAVFAYWWGRNRIVCSAY